MPASVSPRRRVQIEVALRQHELAWHAMTDIAVKVSIR